MTRRRLSIFSFLFLGVFAVHPGPVSAHELPVCVDKESCAANEVGNYILGFTRALSMIRHCPMKSDAKDVPTERLAYSIMYKLSKLVFTEKEKWDGTTKRIGIGKARDIHIMLFYEELACAN